MFVKATVLGCALVSTPICIASIPQDPVKDDQSEQSQPAPAEETKPARSAEVEALKQKIRELEAKASGLQTETDDARRRATEAQAEIAKLKAQLNGCMELLVKSTDKIRHRNCTPSRTRKLLTYFQWMDRNGHKKQADNLMTRVMRDTGNRNSSLNSLAWHLMTEKGIAGTLDRAALAVAQRMEKNGSLRHNEFDTVALASFLNGNAAKAVELQKHAIRRGGNNSEYRRRLRVYEAAVRNGAEADVNPALAGGQ